MMLICFRHGKLKCHRCGEGFKNACETAYHATKVHEGELLEEKEKKRRQDQLPPATAGTSKQFKNDETAKAANQGPSKPRAQRKPRDFGPKGTHQCPECDKCFTTKSSLMRHQRVHKGQGPVVKRGRGRPPKATKAADQHEKSLDINEELFEAVPPSKSDLETDLDYSGGEEEDRVTSNIVEVQETSNSCPQISYTEAEKSGETLDNLEKEDKGPENKNNSGRSVEASSDTEEVVAQSESPAPQETPQDEIRLLPSLMSLVVNPPMRSQVQLPPSRSVQPMWRPRFPTSGFRSRFYIARAREVCYRCGIPGHYPWNCWN